MKTVFCLVAVILGIAPQIHAQGVAVMAKQHARELSNQNNVRQGIAAPTAPATAATPQATRTLPTDPISKLKADLATISGGTAASAELKKQLATNMLACARGSKKPSAAAVQKFADSISNGLAGKSLEPSVVTRLAQDINLALNSGSLPDDRTTKIADDVQAILQTGGVARGQAVNTTGELKAIMAELQAK